MTFWTLYELDIQPWPALNEDGTLARRRTVRSAFHIETYEPKAVAESACTGGFARLRTGCEPAVLGIAMVFEYVASSRGG